MVMKARNDHYRAVTVQRVVIFADWDLWIPQFIVGALLPMIREHEGLQLVGICVPRATAHWKRTTRYWMRRSLGWLKRILFGDTRFLYVTPKPLNLRALAKRYGFAVLLVPDIRQPASCGAALERLRSDILFSVFWTKKFNADFLRQFRQAINYHNGTVPDYRGLNATPWSVYRGETHSGFTVHRINEQLDLGDVLVTGAVPIQPGDSVFDIELRKTRLAVEHLPAVLDALVKELPGIPQTEPHKYNSDRQRGRLVRVEEPTLVSSDELLRRIRAFGSVQIRLRHRYIWLHGLGARIREPTASDRHVLNLRDGSWRMKRSDRIIAGLKIIRSMFARSYRK